MIMTSKTNYKLKIKTKAFNLISKSFSIKTLAVGHRNDDQ